MNKFLPYFVAFCSAILGVFAFAPFNYWFLTYPSLLGLIWVAKLPSRKTALGASFLWGLVFFSFGVSWLHVSINQFGGSSLGVSYLLVVLLSTYLAVYPTLFTLILQCFQIVSPAVMAIAWTFVEYLRSVVFTGFPWLQFGYTQINSPFCGLASLLGVQGLTFFTLWASGMLWLLIQNRNHAKLRKVYALILVGVGLIVSFTAHMNFIKTDPNTSLKVSLLQGNIPQQLKWDSQARQHILDTYHRILTEALNQGENQVVILPEASMPLPENYLTPYLEQISKQAVAKHSDVIIGAVYINSDNQVFNGISVLGENASQGQKNRYFKHHLVPFGEYVPLENLLRPLGSVFNLPMSGFSSGEYRQPNLEVQGQKLAPAICYEIILGEQLRQNLTKDTKYILTISNDAWFGDSIGPWQHLQMAQMRALELGKPVIRATNNGITVIIDHLGKITHQAPQFEKTILSANVPSTKGFTPYALFGNLPLYLLMAFILVQHIFMALLKKAILKQPHKEKSHG